MSGTGTREAPPRALEITLDPRTLVRRTVVVCVVIEILLVLLDYHMNYGRMTEIRSIRRFFNTTREDSLASWFAVTQTAMVALTLWLTWVLVRAAEASRRRQLGWLVLAVFFTYMAVDDGTKLHERLGTAFGRMPEYFPSYAWQILFIPIFAALALFTLVFLWTELQGTRAIVLVVAALSCFVVAVVLDFFEGLDRDHPWNLYAWIDRPRRLRRLHDAAFSQIALRHDRHFSRSFEEFLEMLGMTLFWSVFLAQLPKVGGDVRWRFER